MQNELERLERIAEPAAPAEVTALQRVEVLAALAALSPTEREALLLIAWDGLTPTQAARIAGCTAAAFHLRLFRARRRLRAATTTDDQTIGHTPSTRPARESA